MYRTKQNGYALVVVMIILAVLSISSIALMDNVKLNELSSRNQGNITRAFYAADTSLTTGENWINSSDYVYSQDCDPSQNEANCDTNLIWSSTSNELNFNSFMDSNWWLVNGRVADFNYYSSEDANNQKYARFVIQEKEFVQDDLSFDNNAKQTGVHYYIITSQGLAQELTSRVVMQSIYGKRYR